MEISDLFVDVCDGLLLMKLLEIISGDKLGKPNRGRMRVHKIENLNRVLEYLKKKRITLENIGAEDILDGNPRLILGLIWTIILRFIIEPIEIPAVSDVSSRFTYRLVIISSFCRTKMKAPRRNSPKTLYFCGANARPPGTPMLKSTILRAAGAAAWGSTP